MNGLMIVGSSQATEEQFNKTIKRWFDRYCLSLAFYRITIVNADCKGVDKIAMNVAESMGLKTKKITAELLKLENNSKFDYFNNIDIMNTVAAESCSWAICFALPYGTTVMKNGKPRPKCSHCRMAGLADNHEKTNGCKYALKVPVHKTIVIGEELK